MMNLLLSSLDKGARFFRQRQFFCRLFVSSEAHSIKFAASTTRQCPFLSHLESTSIKALPKTALTTFRMNTSKSVSEQRTLTPFRMNTFEKKAGGYSYLLTRS